MLQCLQWLQWWGLAYVKRNGNSSFSCPCHVHILQNTRCTGPVLCVTCVHLCTFCVIDTDIIVCCWRLCYTFKCMYLLHILYMHSLRLVPQCHKTGGSSTESWSVQYHRTGSKWHFLDWKGTDCIDRQPCLHRHRFNCILKLCSLAMNSNLQSYGTICAACTSPCYEFPLPDVFKCTQYVAVGNG